MKIYQSKNRPFPPITTKHPGRISSKVGHYTSPCIHQAKHQAHSPSPVHPTGFVWNRTSSNSVVYGLFPFEITGFRCRILEEHLFRHRDELSVPYVIITNHRIDRIHLCSQFNQLWYFAKTGGGIFISPIITRLSIWLMRLHLNIAEKLGHSRMLPPGPASSSCEVIMNPPNIAPTFIQQITQMMHTDYVQYIYSKFSI